MQRFDLVGSGIVRTATARVHADSRICVFFYTSSVEVRRRGGTVCDCLRCSWSLSQDVALCVVRHLGRSPSVKHKLLVVMRRFRRLTFQGRPGCEFASAPTASKSSAK